MCSRLSTRAVSVRRSVAVSRSWAAANNEQGKAHCINTLSLSKKLPVPSSSVLRLLESEKLPQPMRCVKSDGFAEILFNNTPPIIAVDTTPPFSSRVQVPSRYHL